MLTIVISVKEYRGISQKFLESNKEVLVKYPTIVIDSGGGELLKKYCFLYIRKEVPFWEARKLGYSKVKTPFILNLDADVIVPKGYVEKALEILKQQKILGAVSIFFEDEDVAGLRSHKGILEFGVSLWKTELLKSLYDYRKPNSCCECIYMWRQLEKAGFRLETLPMRAKHLK